LDKRRPTAEGNTLRKIRIRDGFPGAPENMDAAFVWSGNGRIYFIKGLCLGENNEMLRAAIISVPAAY